MTIALLYLYQRFFRLCVTVMIFISFNGTIILTSRHPEHPVLLEA